MNLIWFFCIYMTFIYMPFDLFIKPVANDAEVWFGFVLHGWYAKATEPLHWAIYAAGTYGFWKMKPWMHPWASLYVIQVAIAMGVFSLKSSTGTAQLFAIVPFTIFLIPAIALWRAHDRFSKS